MNNEFYKTKTSIGAALAFIGFFLPWVTFGFITFSGYEIPELAETLSSLNRSFTNRDVSSGTQLYYFLYLIPLLSAYLLFGEYKGSRQFFVQAKVVIFLLSAAVAFKLSTFEMQNIFDLAGIGFWLTFGGSVYLLIQAIKEFQASRKNPVVGSETNASESRTSNTEAFDFAAFQAKVQEAFKLSPAGRYIVLAFTGIIVLVLSLNFLFTKNSFQEVMSDLEDHKWEELKFNYRRSLAAIEKGELELDYDETKKLEIANSIADILIPIDEFKKKYYSTKNTTIETFYELDKEWVILPDLKTKPTYSETQGIDVDKIYEPYVAFTDSFNLAFMEMHFSESLKQRFQASNLDEVEGILQHIDGNKEIILSRIIDSENKEVQTRMGKVENKLAELKSLAAGLIAEQSQPVIADLEYEEIDDEPSFAADFFGTWTGNKGDEEIEIVFNSVHGDSIFGYNTVDQTKRPLSGLVTLEADGFTFSLLEPVDEEGAGVFTLKMDNDSEYVAVGEWLANNGTSPENVHIKLQ